MEEVEEEEGGGGEGGGGVSYCNYRKLTSCYSVAAQPSEGAVIQTVTTVTGAP